MLLKNDKAIGITDTTLMLAKKIYFLQVLLVTWFSNKEVILLPFQKVICSF